MCIRDSYEAEPSKRAAILEERCARCQLGAIILLKMQKHKEATRELPCACMPELRQLLLLLLACFFFYWPVQVLVCPDILLFADLLKRRLVKFIMILLRLFASLQILMSVGPMGTRGSGKSKYLRCCRRLLGGRDYQLAWDKIPCWRGDGADPTNCVPLWIHHIGMSARKLPFLYPSDCWSGRWPMQTAGRVRLFFLARLCVLQTWRPPC